MVQGYGLPFHCVRAIATVTSERRSPIAGLEHKDGKHWYRNILQFIDLVKKSSTISARLVTDDGLESQPAHNNQFKGARKRVILDVILVLFTRMSALCLNLILEVALP